MPNSKSTAKPKSFWKNNAELTCQMCGSPFHSTQRGRRGREAKYCSNKCQNATRTRNQLSKACEYCGVEFFYFPSRAKFGAAKFCSAICSAASMKSRPVTERFWPKVSKTPTCWIWMGAHNEDGYGLIYIEGKMIAAHRMSWELSNGPIPPSASILHKCDNPPCVNPDHLYAGTQSDNVHDMLARGRAHWQQKSYR